MSEGRLRSYEPLLISTHRVVDPLVAALVFLALSVYYRTYHEPLYPAAASVIFLQGFGIFHLAGIYRSWRGTPLRQELYRVLLGCLILFSSSLILAYTLKLSAIYEREVVLSWMVVLPILLCTERIVLRTIVRRLRAKGWNLRSAVVAGRGHLAEHLIAWFKENPWIGAQIVGFFDDKSDAPLDSLPYLGPLMDLPQYVKEKNVHQVYLALPTKAYEKTEWLVRELADTTASVFVVPDVFLLDVFLGGHIIRLDNMAFVGLWDSPHIGVNNLLKRTEDLILGSLALLLAAPVMAVIAVLVKLTSPGPILFKQWRYGLDGQPIKVYKFRTMSVCEDGYVFKQATKGDPRVTPLGRFLRKTSLDELPQLINVIQGRLSLVGPRPHPVALNEEFRKKVFGYMLRHKVRPGITGLAQVKGWRGETDTLEKMQKRVEFDLEYLRSWSLWLDIKILFLTVFQVWKSENAY